MDCTIHVNHTHVSYALYSYFENCLMISKLLHIQNLIYFTRVNICIIMPEYTVLFLPKSSAVAF